MHKFGLALLTVTLIAGTAMAGGGIFGHKHKTVNTNGVHSIGVHICGSLECPPVRIFEGKCNQEHMSMHWGVCVCDKGYVPKNGKCDACPEGQYSDGIHGCKSCPDEMYAEAGDTKCTTCPTPIETICNGDPAKDSHNCPTQNFLECSGTTPVCKADNKTCECPENANCTVTPWACNDGYFRNADTCVKCPDENATKCNGDGISTECKEGYEVKDDTCVEVSTCSSTIGDPCKDNSTVCPGYYCSIAGGTTKTEQWCGTDEYTPGAGTIQALGEPVSKTSADGSKSFLSSPNGVYMSWDAAVNYCDALKNTIATKTTVGTIDYGSYMPLSKGLADLPTTCEWGKNCSALPIDRDYWLNVLIQANCNNFSEYSTTYGSSSTQAIYIYTGDVASNGRHTEGYPLCE